MGAQRKSWLDWYSRGRPIPTDDECVESCLANARESRSAEVRARQWHAQAQRGTEDCDKAWQAVCRHVSDRRHWTEMADYYQGLVDAAAREAARLAALGPPPARERVVGEDDGEEQEERLSAWADLGAAVPG